MEIRRDPSLVAIVDDEAPIREAIGSLLRSAGFAAAGFASAEDFLSSEWLVRSGCVILDIRLPGMSGLDLQRHLSRDGVGLPIVFITAQADCEGRLETQALQAGAVAFLRKPFTDEDLLTAVRNAVRRPHS